MDNISFELKFSRYGNVPHTSATHSLVLVLQFLIAEIKRELRDKIFESKNLLCENYSSSVKHDKAALVSDILNIAQILFYFNGSKKTL